MRTTKREMKYAVIVVLVLIVFFLSVGLYRKNNSTSISFDDDLKIISMRESRTPFIHKYFLVLEFEEVQGGRLEAEVSEEYYNTLKVGDIVRVKVCETHFSWKNSILYSISLIQNGFSQNEN